MSLVFSAFAILLHALASRGWPACPARAADTNIDFVRHFESLLQAAASSPDVRISELTLLAAEERRQLLDWNATGREYRRHDLVRALCGNLTH